MNLTKVRRPRCEGDHTPQSSAEDINGGAVFMFLHTSSRQDAKLTDPGTDLPLTYH
jgi:hypothetical protein